jgi:hypothetical protein
MPFEILDIGVQQNDFQELTQVDEEVQFGPKRGADISLPRKPISLAMKKGEIDWGEAGAQDK